MKDCTYIYEKEFDLMREKYNLKGQVKSVSNIICEYMITSDQKYFESIGEEETRRYFETAYKFVCEYQNLGEEHIISAKVHMDEDSHHLHLVFVLVVHTKDSKGNYIRKIACSEFWKVRDSYRQLQNAFHSYVTKHGFKLERGLPKVPELKDMKKVIIGRDDKILNEIIKPKGKLIKELYRDNLALHKELSKQAIVIEKTEKYQNERDKIITDNVELNNTVKYLEHEYKKKSNTLDLRYDIRKREPEKNLKKKLIT